MPFPFTDPDPADPSLVFRRDGSPGLHVLLAGASAYPDLDPDHPRTNADLRVVRRQMGLRPLSSTCLTIYRMLEWLFKADADGRLHFPLASVRVLLSPAAGEIQAEPGLEQLSQRQVPGCDMQGFVDAAQLWREDASHSVGDATFFYFAGHGLTAEGGQALVMNDFNGKTPLMVRTIAEETLFAGMVPTPSRPDIARTQFYFLDACRNVPAEINQFRALEATPAFEVERQTLADDRRAPRFYAALDGDKALALRLKQTVFSEALIDCLDKTGSQPPEGNPGQRTARDFHVSVNSLIKGLEYSISRLNARYSTGQDFTPTGLLKPAVLCYLPQPPEIDITFQVDPEAAARTARLRLMNFGPPGPALLEVDGAAAAYPFVGRVRAGYYQLQAEVAVHYNPVHVPPVVPVMPPSGQLIVQCSNAGVPTGATGTVAGVVTVHATGGG